FSFLDAFDDAEPSAPRGLLPQRRERRVLRRAIPRERLLVARELEHYEAARLPSALQAFGAPAPYEEPPPVLLEGGKDLPAVVVVFLRIRNLHLREHVGGHATTPFCSGLNRGPIIPSSPAGRCGRRRQEGPPRPPRRTCARGCRAG